MLQRLQNLSGEYHNSLELNNAFLAHLVDPKQLDLVSVDKKLSSHKSYR